MITVRPQTFETNSSSCHALLLVNEQEMDKLLKRELYIVDETLTTPDELYNDFIGEISDCEIPSKEDFIAFVNEVCDILKNKGYTYYDSYDLYNTNPPKEPWKHKAIEFMNSWDVRDKASFGRYNVFHSKRIFGNEIIHAFGYYTEG